MRFGEQWFKRTSDSGEQFAFRAKISVVQNGTFHANVPDEYKDMFAHCEGTERYNGRSNKVRFVAKTLEGLTANINKAIDEYLKFETRTELVIRYDVRTRCHYCRDDEGKIYPTGGIMQKAVGKYTWADMLNVKSNFASDDDYSVFLKAEVSEKEIMTRGANYTHVEYGPPVDDTIGKYGQLLNAFAKISLPDKAQEMPYTEEAAKFFYMGMTSLCQLADNLQQFFGDESAAQAAIQAGVGIKLLEMKK